MDEKILEYAEDKFIRREFDMSRGIIEYYEIVGERTNGMELKVERDLYYNTVVRMAQDYLNELSIKFLRFGEVFNKLNENFKHYYNHD